MTLLDKHSFAEHLEVYISTMMFASDTLHVGQKHPPDPTHHSGLPFIAFVRRSFWSCMERMCKVWKTLYDTSSS